MKTSVIGFPRIGKNRELKFAEEKYFKGEYSEKELLEEARAQRSYGLKAQKDAGIDFISSNDFSFYDSVLDTAVFFNAIPERYKALNLSDIDTYFAMARGYQGENGNVKALAMKKWFNTNYHYIVPEIDDSTVLKLTGTKIFEDFDEAKEAGINTKPVLIGPFTFLKLARFTGSKNAFAFWESLAEEYADLTRKLNEKGADWIQFDEPSLVKDLSEEDKDLFKNTSSDIFRRCTGYLFRTCFT